MQYTSAESKNASSPIHKISESLRDSAEHMASDLGNKSAHYAQDLSENADAYYSKASSWIEKNYGKTLGVVGLLAAIGTVGYYLGRNNARTQPDPLQSPRS